MFGADRKTTHARLMGRMADTLGHDFEALRQAGKFDPEAEAEAVQRCCGCRSVGTCEDWLEDHADGAPAAPGFCANAAMMSGFADLAKA